MTDQASATDKVEETPPPMTWVDFLQAQPPGSVAQVTGASRRDQYGNYYLLAPELHLFCPNDTCNAYMFFTSDDSHTALKQGEWKFTYLSYRCRNCRTYLNPNS